MRSDLSMLREFGETLTPPTGEPPAEVRHRVMRGISRGGRRTRLVPRMTGVRLAWRIGAPAGVAAAIAAALVAGQMADVAGNAPAPPGGHAATGAASAPETAPTAQRVLRLAAQHAAATPVLDARPDQFLFVDSMEVQSKIDLKRRPDGTVVTGKARTTPPLRVRTWLSVDGTRDGLVTEEPARASGRTRPTRTHLSGCRNGLQAETIDRPQTTPKVPCTPEPAYRPDSVPTDPDRLRAHVYDPAVAGEQYVYVPGAGPSGKGGFVRLSVHQRAFQEIIGLLYANHSPAVQEAAFRAAERIPGVRVREDVADAAGRIGIAVTRTEAGAREELVFDPRTYRYLGHNAIVAELDASSVDITSLPERGRNVSAVVHRGPGKPGDIIQKSALLGIAIVDRAGQRP
jgi:hypothetical protein